jgi:hypothetical protein
VSVCEGVRVGVFVSVCECGCGCGCVKRDYTAVIKCELFS